jgi:hypothetical protein
MDEHYDINDAREQMLHDHNMHTESNLGDRLEKWTNIRNTKSQYRKQLRNFVKVC